MDGQMISELDKIEAIGHSSFEDYAKADGAMINLYGLSID